jgi:phage N-6-adenine-methyltransferase
MNKVHFSSKRQDWATPWDLFRELNTKHGKFILDVCASAENTKVENFYSENGLGLDWHGKCWMNPPYGREIGKWVKKAYEESQKGCKVVALLPARTDTKWFHDYCLKGKVEFLRGRIKFVGALHPAPFPSMVVVWE